MNQRFTDNRRNPNNNDGFSDVFDQSNNSPFNNPQRNRATPRDEQPFSNKTYYDPREAQQSRQGQPNQPNTDNNRDRFTNQGPPPGPRQSQNMPPNGQPNPNQKGGRFGIKNRLGGIKTNITINDILMAPLSALYAFTLKTHEGFKLDEEVKALALIQVVYLVLGVFSGSKVFLILTIGNILSIVVVLVLASSYINLPDFLVPGGLLKRKQQHQHYQEYNEPRQEYEQPPRQQYNQPKPPNDPYNNQFGMGNNIQFEDNNVNTATPGMKEPMRTRKPGINSMGEDMYNPYIEDRNPFNNAGLNTNGDYEKEVIFDTNNTSGVSNALNNQDRDEFRPTQGFNNNQYSDNQSKNIDFQNMNPSRFIPSTNNVVRNPKFTREQLYENNPMKERLINRPEDKQRLFNEMENRGNYKRREFQEHKQSKNILNMVKDGFLTSLSNSNFLQEDEDIEIL